MNNRICQNCKNDFEIITDELSFYEKLKIVPPSWCASCRMARTMSFINIRSFYKRTCNLCGKFIITLYKITDKAPVYCNECWQSDNWDVSVYSKEIDTSKTFFEQWHELFQIVPRQALRRVQMVDSDYMNLSIQCNHCYLGYSIFRSEYVNYSECVDDSKNCTDCITTKGSEWCYESADSISNYNCCYISESKNCINSQFLLNCANCQDCFMSSNLRNSRYVFRNTQLSKEEYTLNIANESLDKYSNIRNLMNEFKSLKENSIHKYADIINSINATGNNIVNSKNVINSYMIADGENINNSVRILEVKDMGNCFFVAGSESLYSCFSCSLGSYQMRNCMYSNGSKDLDYCYLCTNCENLFGCIGLKNQKYCIFNKQYSKKEYFEKVEEIKISMTLNPYIDIAGRSYVYGDFFPFAMSPFSYNETMARDYFPITEEEVVKNGFVNLDPKQHSYNVTIKASMLPDSINEYTDSICSEIIECEHKGECNDQCATAFRIIPDDYISYKKMNIPIPRLCPNCRYYARLASRPPRKLWERSCMCDKTNHGHETNCTTLFKTSYSPNRPEIVYCESCYQKEVL